MFENFSQLTTNCFLKLDSVHSTVLAMQTRLHDTCLTKEKQICWNNHICILKLLCVVLPFAFKILSAEPSVFIPTAKFHKATAQAWTCIKTEQCSSLLKENCCSSFTIKLRFSNSMSEWRLFFVRFFVVAVRVRYLKHIVDDIFHSVSPKAISSWNFQPTFQSWN